MPTFDTNTALYMVFDLLLIGILGLLIYLHVLTNSDLLIAAIGAVLRGGFGLIPSSKALAQNTAATKENTAATQAAVEPLASAKGTV